MEVTTRDALVALIAFALGAVVMGEYIKHNMHAVIDVLEKSQRATAGDGV